MPPLARPKAAPLRPVLPSPSSGDAKIDVILKRIDRLEQVVREMRFEIEGVVMEHTDRVIRSMHEND
jgi:hypothetical protein